MPYNQKFYSDFFDFLRNVSSKHNFKFKAHWDGGELWDKSLKRLNITAFADFYNCKVQIATEVGVSGGSYNKNLYEKLRHSTNAVNKIEKIYTACEYDRHIRLYNYNRFKDSCRYFWIKNFDSLKDYLNSFSDVEYSKISRSQCIKNLLSLNGTAWAQDKNMQGVPLNARQVLTVWNFEEYHWLEYLRIIEFIDGNLIYGENINSISKILNPIIEKHIEGIKIIHSICPANV